jgi:hypothetical protein
LFSVLIQKDISPRAFKSEQMTSANAPVPLTKDQINSILEEIPDPPGVGKTAIAIARKHLSARLKDVLKDIRLVLSTAAFEEFKDELVGSLYQSHIEPGTAVGVTAGVSLGAPVTQLSLNSFHFAGSQSGVAMAFQRIRDFLTGSKLNRNPTMKIFLKRASLDYPANNLHTTRHIGTFDMIINLKAQFEQTMVGDLVVDDGVRLLTYDESVAAGVPQLKDLFVLTEPQRFTNRTFPLTYVVQVQLNTYRMYTHRITMAMVAAAIEGPSPPDALTVIWKSQLDGRIYILVDETRDYGQQAMNQQSAIQMYLQREVINKFSQWQISGIPGILTIDPNEINVFAGIHRVRRSRTDPSLHKIYTSNYRTRWEGISLADIHHLFTSAGFNTGPINEEQLYFPVVYDHEDFNVNRIPQLLQLLRSIDSDKLNDLQKRALSGKPLGLMDALNLIVEHAKSVPEAQRTIREEQIVEASSYYCIKSDGANIEDTVWREDIDQFRTSTNYSHQVADMFGIDAALIFLIFSFNQTLQDFGSYVNGRHIGLIFGLLCNLGMINSLTFAGINRRRIGALAAASSERSMDVFMNRSTFGDSEAIDGVSEAIYVGQKSKKVGTGSIAIEGDLSLIPQTRPILPSVDEASSFYGVVIEEDFPEMEEEVMIRTAPGPVDKSRIQRKSIISSTPVATEVSLLPPGAEMVMASSTLLNALQKVTTGTQLEVTPKYKVPQVINPAEITPDGISPNINVMDSFAGLQLTAGPPAQRGRPASSPAMEGLLESLKTISTGGIEVPLQPTPDDESLVAAPLTPTGLLPDAPVFVPTVMAPQIPILAPPPRVSPPRAPQAISPMIPEIAGAESPSSFLSLFPDVSAESIPESSGTQVLPISIKDFLRD